jgi:23S rRNA (cytidine1920-2'-O)/16S rRNA (cytidine1409-2'-O)-methyltransferase
LRAQLTVLSGTLTARAVRFRSAMARVRLDTLLTERGLFPSRTRAAASVMAGEVLVGDERRRAAKPSEMVSPSVVLDVQGGLEYVSRGGVKLANALDALGVSCSGRQCLDVGASTGGFTDVLLQRGATSVAAVDVAYGELAWKLRQDSRVVVLERLNARRLAPSDLPFASELLVSDVSFISLTKVLPAVLACMAPTWEGLVMVKPQFEVGRALVGKGGVVRSAASRRSALVSVASCAASLGASVLGFASSGLPGPKGNRETFLWLSDGSRPSVDIEAAALEAEPDE